jgi:hypothetical protein
MRGQPRNPPALPVQDSAIHSEGSLQMSTVRREINKWSGKCLTELEAHTNAPAVNNVPKQKQKKLRGLSPRANYTDLAIATCRRS